MAKAQYDKFIELRQSGVDAKTAKKQAYGDILSPVTNAPVANTNQQVLAQNQARVQSEIQAGTRPEAGFVGNAVQDLGGDVANRQNTRNVMTGQGGTRTPNGAILNADGTVTQTPESIASNAGSTIVGNQYDQRTPEQKAIGATATPEQAMKSTGGVIGAETTPPTTPATPPAQTTPTTPKTTTAVTPPPPKDQASILSSFMSGVPVAPQNTPEYRKADSQYKGFQKFNAMSSQQLLDNIKQGQVTTEMSGMLANNPAYQEARAKLDAENKVKTMNTVYKGFTSEGPTQVEDYLQKISDTISKKYGLTNETAQQSFSRIVSQNPDVVKYTTELRNINQQASDTTKLINDGYKEVKAKYQGKLSASQLLTYMGNRFRDATDLLTNLNTTKQYLESDLKNAVDLATGEYNAQLVDRQETSKLRDTILNAQLGLVTDQAKLQMQADFAKKQAQEAFNDPVTAVSSIYKKYEEMGIPFTRSLQEITREAQDYVAQGGDLADYLTDLQSKIQSKPEYTAIQENKRGEGISYQVFGDTVYKKMPNGDLVKTNISASKVESKDTKPFQVGSSTYQYNPQTGGYQIISGQGATTTPSGYYGGFRITQNAGDKSPNTRDNGYNGGTPGIDFAMPENTPVMATTTGKVTFVGKKGDYGNQIVVTDAQGNQHMFSHLNGSEVKIGDSVTSGQRIGLSGNTGFSTGAHLDYRVKGASGKWEDPKMFVTQEYSPQDIELLSEIAQMTSETARNTALKNAGISMRQLADYTQKAKSGAIPPTEIQKQAALGTLSNIQGLAELDWSDAVGKFDYSRLMGLQDAENASTLIENMRDAAALNNLGLLKGPMSDKDIAFLKSVSSKLNPTQSNEQFEKNIVEMYNIAARKAGVTEIKGLSDIPKERILPGQTVSNVNTGAGQLSQQQLDTVADDLFLKYTNR